MSRVVRLVFEFLKLSLYIAHGACDVGTAFIRIFTSSANVSACLE